MKKPDFKKIKYQRKTASTSSKKKATPWKTPEGITIPLHFDAEAIKDVKHLSYVAGIPPYLRGPYSSMYAVRPWTIRQYAGFSTAKKVMNFTAKI